MDEKKNNRWTTKGLSLTIEPKYMVITVTAKERSCEEKKKEIQ